MVVRECVKPSIAKLLVPRTIFALLVATDALADVFQVREELVAAHMHETNRLSMNAIPCVVYGSYPDHSEWGIIQKAGVVEHGMRKHPHLGGIKNTTIEAINDIRIAEVKAAVSRSQNLQAGDQFRDVTNIFLLTQSFDERLQCWNS